MTCQWMKKFVLIALPICCIAFYYGPYSYGAPTNCNYSLTNVMRLPRPQMPEESPFASGKRIRLAQAPANPNQAAQLLHLENSLVGPWDRVVGHVGFWHTFDQGFGTMFVSIIGLPTQPDGRGNYSSVNWDKKIFWFDVGDGPMHLPASYSSEAFDPETGETFHAFSARSLFFQRPGVDYSGYELGSQYMEILLFVEKTTLRAVGYEVILYGPDFITPVETTELKIGDRVQSWALAFKLHEPERLYLASMEEDFRTVTSPPQFYYEHWTPNKDFPNPFTLGKIRFGDKDLLYLLSGEAVGQNGAQDHFGYSQPKDLKVKWDAQQTSGFWNWLFMK